MIQRPVPVPDRQTMANGAGDIGLCSGHSRHQLITQRQSRGYVVPDSFTHGTSAQRVRWFRRGLESGNLADGDTFNTNDL